MYKFEYNIKVNNAISFNRGAKLVYRLSPSRVIKYKAQYVSTLLIRKRNRHVKSVCLFSRFSKRYKLFKMSRHFIKRFSSKGFIVGLRKSSW